MKKILCIIIAIIAVIVVVSLFYSFSNQNRISEVKFEKLLDSLVKDSNVVATTTQAMDALTQDRDTLAKMADGNDVIYLSQAILKINDDPEQGLARSYLIGILARVRNESTVTALINLCLTTTNPAIYTSAAIALGGIGSPEAVSGLVKIIDNKQIGERKVTDLNDSAIQALFSVKNKNSLTKLKELKDNATTPMMREIIDTAISNLEK